MAQAGVVLEAYPDDVIEYVTAPQTGIQRTQKFAPTIAEITQACDARAAELVQQQKNDEWARKKRESDAIRARQAMPSEAPRTANLFVPSDTARYEKMVAKHNAEPDRGSYFEERVCHDGVKRQGIWVPLDWWEEPSGAKKQANELRPLAVSEHLKALVQRQLGERAA